MRLAVLGSPIAHSKSPALHRAAYRALGLDWSYDAIDVASGELREFVDGCDDSWGGLSLTMPLKRDVLPLLTTMDEFTELTGGANTLRFDGTDRHGYNTDVTGAVAAFRAAGVFSLHGVRILGGGATAASMLVAASLLGAGRALIAVRSPERVGALVALGEQLDLDISVHSLEAPETGWIPDAVISTLPNGTDFSAARSAVPVPGAVLFDVAYEPWPTALAAAWLAAGATVIPGIELLAHQALAQVRVFVNGSTESALADETSVFTAMRLAVGLDT